MVTVRNGQERSETVRNGQKRSGTVRNGHGNGRGNGQERWTIRDGERYETIILYKINGQKRLSNHVHGAFTVRSRSRFKNERITVFFLQILIENFFFRNYAEVKNNKIISGNNSKNIFQFFIFFFILVKSFSGYFR